MIVPNAHYTNTQTAHTFVHLHRVSNSNDTLIFKKNNLVKNELILIIFGVQIPEEMSHQMIINVSTSPGKCSNCTHTHNTHNRFTALLEYVRDHPGEQVPER